MAFNLYNYVSNSNGIFGFVLLLIWYFRVIKPQYDVVAVGGIPITKRADTTIKNLPHHSWINYNNTNINGFRWIRN